MLIMMTTTNKTEGTKAAGKLWRRIIATAAAAAAGATCHTDLVYRFAQSASNLF
jgi:hypothetical protein